MTLLFRLLGRFPLRTLHRLGALLGWAAWFASPAYRRHLKENLALAYDPAEAKAILPAAIAHAGRGVLELPWAPSGKGSECHFTQTCSSWQTSCMWAVSA